MKKSNRALLGLVLINAALFAGAWWLIAQTRSGALQAPDPAEAIARITTVAGGAMGIVTAILLMAYIAHKRRGN